MTALVARTVGLVPRAALALPPRLRRRLAVLLGVCALVALAYLGWFRDSSLVAVERVEVTGLSTPDAGRIEAALERAAEDMTTLHLRLDELERAVAGFPIVRSLEVAPDFPHGLAIRVVEHRPVALLASGRERVPVAGDGTLLPDVPVSGGLPSLRVEASVRDERLGDESARALVAVTAAAPGALLAELERVSVTGGRGIVAALRDGPDVVLGAPSRARAKWLAAARVLADPSAAGATYVDVRIPERPTAGGLAAETLAPLAPAGTPQPPAGPGTQPLPGAPSQPPTGAAPQAP